PAEPPLALTLKNVTFAAPMVVLAMLTPMPPAAETVLDEFVAVTVPPPVALNAVPVVVVRPRFPLNAIVAPVLVVRLIAFAVDVDAVIAPLKVYVPVLFEVTLT